jgi:hypothetical protein
MTGTQLFSLQRPTQLCIRKRRLNGLATMTINDTHIVSMQRFRACQNVRQQGPSSQWLQYFGKLGPHARALSCCQNDDA